MNTLSLTGLEKQLLVQVFSNTATDDPNTLDQLQGLQKTQSTMVSYAFRDFVDYFLKLDALAKAAAKAQAQTLPPGSGPLYAAPLHLDLRIERYQQLAPAEVDDTQPVSVHKLVNDDGVASRIEICTPELQADGSLSYAITVIKLAVSTRLEGQTATAVASGSAGQPPVAAAGGTAGGHLQDFLDQGDYQGPSEAVWDYVNEDAMDLLEEQERQDQIVAELKFRQVMAAAYAVLAYIQKTERNAFFDLNEDEQKLVAQATSGDPRQVSHQALLRFIKKKRVELEMARKEIQQKLQATQDAHKIAQAQAALNRLINAFEQVQQLLEKNQTVDPQMFSELMAAFDAANQGAFGDAPPRVSANLTAFDAAVAGG